MKSMLEADAPKLDPETYADRVLVTASPPVRLNDTGCLLHAALGVASEGGELCDAIKRVAFYGKPLDRVNVIEECGDALWYIAYALRSVGGTFEEAMLANIAKLEKRYPGGKFTLERSEGRDTAAERVVLEEHTK